jgi:predicted DNA-binding protein
MVSKIKVTFTLDVETVARLRAISLRTSKPQSLVVREAVKDYEARAAMLSDEERAHALAIVDRMTHEPPTRTATEVDAELRAIRTSRRRWSRSKSSRRRP